MTISYEINLFKATTTGAFFTEEITLILEELDWPFFSRNVIMMMASTLVCVYP